MNNCSQRGIFIVATSNRPDKIDPAVLRTGRVDKMVYVPLPDFEARKEMFKLHLNGRPLKDDINYDELAQLTEGYIASDITYIVNDAAMAAAFNRLPISHELLLATVRTTRPSLHSSSIEMYERMREKIESNDRRNLAERPSVGFKP
jgi:transitional endoplasmic reticulum ATPase